MNEGAQQQSQAGALPAIAMQPVKSTNIAALGFDAPTKTLAVHFANGGMYHYTGVPQEVFTELLQAPSPGGAFATKVRGKFPGKKIGLEGQQPQNPPEQRAESVRPTSD